MGDEPGDLVGGEKGPSLLAQRRGVVGMDGVRESHRRHSILQRARTRLASLSGRGLEMDRRWTRSRRVRMPSRPGVADGARDCERWPNASCSTGTLRFPQASWSPWTSEDCPAHARLGLPSLPRSARGGRFGATPIRRVSVEGHWPMRFRVSCRPPKLPPGRFAWRSWACSILCLHTYQSCGAPEGRRLAHEIIYSAVNLHSST